MSSVFDNEILTHTVTEGTVSSEAPDRPSLKLNTKPRIAICVPVGTKKQAQIFDTPDGNKWMAHAASVPACIPVQWVVAKNNMLPPLGISTTTLWQWGMLSGQARQIMTARAMRVVQDDGYLLFWDDDVIVEQMSLYTLYSFMEQHPEAGAVTGIYSTRQEPTEPVLYKEHMKGPHWGVSVGPYAEPEEVFGAGAGFLLVRAAAIRDMMKLANGKPIWADSKTLPAKDQKEGVRFTTTWGHDIRFCALLQEAGWKMFAHGQVELGHFDAVEQKEYRLPMDSPPKLRGYRKAMKPVEDNSICLILPTYGHLDYAEKAARSFLANTKTSRAVVCAVDDGSPGVTNEEYAAWAKNAGIQYAFRFDENDGLTRSWNHGLQYCRDHGIRYAVCGNSDLIFSPGWDIGVISALEDHELVGPVTNAPGWGMPLQNVASFVPGYEPSDDPAEIAAVAEKLSVFPSETLLEPVTTFGPTGAQVRIDQFLNGFCLVARTNVWWSGAFDGENVFDPSHKLTENETELQARWVVGQGARRALVSSSFVFHYRSVTRGDKFKSAGAFRPAVTA